MVVLTASAQDFDFNKNTIEMDSTANSSFLVCKLSGPELQKRKAALQLEIFSNVKKYLELENGYAFYFDDREGFLEKLLDYMLAERKCCPFFEFDLTIKPDNEGIELSLTGPDGVKDLMNELIGKN